MERYLIGVALLAVVASGCATDGPGDVVLPPMGADGKADEWTQSIEFGPSDTGGRVGTLDGTFGDTGQGALPVAFDLRSMKEYHVQITVQVSAGEPHLYLRRAPDTEVIAAAHADGSQTANLDTVIAPSDPDGWFGEDTFQVALQVAGATGGTFHLVIQADAGCTEDDYEVNDAGENDSPATATPLDRPGLYVADACNSFDGQSDADYYSVVLQPLETLHAVMSHHEPFGPLGMTVEGASTPVQVSLHETGVQEATVVAGSDGEEVIIGVGGDGPWNLYQLSVCIDDRLEGRGNDVEASAIPLDPGTYTGLRLCNFFLSGPPLAGLMTEQTTFDHTDDDWYQVEVEPYHVLRVETELGDGVEFLPAAGMLSPSSGVYQFENGAEAQTVFFAFRASDVSAGIFGSDFSGYLTYDLSVSTL